MSLQAMQECPPRSSCDAAIVVVGDELLSGSVADSNGPRIAAALREAGIEVREMRVIGDHPGHIATVVRSLRLSYSWLFVAGGLGPTHDDCTARGIADAFGLPLVPHPDALQLLAEHHAPSPVPTGRLPGANLPRDCAILPDLISGTAGFRLRNVIALPGVPEITASMLPIALAQLPRGVALEERAITVAHLEPEIAGILGETQRRHPAVKIGCYPYFGSTRAGVKLLLRSADRAALALCERELRLRLRRMVATQPRTRFMRAPVG